MARQQFPLPCSHACRPLWSPLVQTTARPPPSPILPMAHDPHSPRDPSLAQQLSKCGLCPAVPAGSVLEMRLSGPTAHLLNRRPLGGVGAALWGSRHTLWSGGHCAGTGQASSVPKGSTMGSHHSRGIYQCFPWAGNLLRPCKSHRWWTNRRCISPVVGWWRPKAEGGGGGGMFQVTQLAPPVPPGDRGLEGKGQALCSLHLPKAGRPPCCPSSDLHPSGTG